MGRMLLSVVAVAVLFSVAGSALAANSVTANNS